MSIESAPNVASCQTTSGRGAIGLEIVRIQIAPAPLTADVGSARAVLLTRFVAERRPSRRKVEALGDVGMELFVFRAAPFRMRDKTIDDERPMRLRHAALGRASSEARECPLDLSSGRFALRRTVEPFDEKIVGF